MMDQHTVRVIDDSTNVLTTPYLMTASTLPPPLPSTSSAWEIGNFIPSKAGECSAPYGGCSATHRATLYTAAALQLLQGSLSTGSAEDLVSALQRARSETCAQQKTSTLRGALGALLEHRQRGAGRTRERKAAHRESAFATLPEELATCILRQLSAKDLARASGTCRSWRAESTRVAEEKLRACRHGGPSLDGLNWLRALAAEEALASAVGPRPKHAWWTEWAPMRVEEVLLTGQPERFAHAPLYERKGPMSVMAMLCRYAGGLSWMFDCGWPLHQAAACLLIGTFGTAALGMYLRSNSARYAASTYAYCDALWARASTLRCAAPLAFASVDGLFGLGSTDPAWLALNDEVEPGTSFQTTAAVMATLEPCSLYAPHAPHAAPTLAAQSNGTVICFHSECRDNSNGLLRSLIPVSPTSFHLPPLATVTVLCERQAGEWAVFGQTMWRRSIHVVVSMPY